jgi:hypothetical protein
VNRVTIAMFAIVIAYVDGFWVTSFQGAVGSFERAEPPFRRWLRDSTLMLPLFVIAMLAAMLLARRWVGPTRRTLVQVAATALLVVLISSALSITEMAASSAWDYHLQTRGLDLVDSPHGQHAAATPQGSLEPEGRSSCLGACAAKQLAFDVHVKAVALASVVLVISNVILVAWLLALRSDRLWGARSGKFVSRPHPRLARVTRGWGVPANASPSRPTGGYH